MNEPAEELAAVGLAAPAEEGAELRKQQSEGSSRQGALRRDPPARPFTGLVQVCCTATPNHSIDRVAYLSDTLVAMAA